MSDFKGKPSILGGSMIVAGTSIGAGMLALPTISAGMWFFWSIPLLFVTWLLLLLSSQALLEVNLHYEPGSSFHTMTKSTLGPFWSLVNGLSVAFVLYILAYAYVSGGGSMVRHTFIAVAGGEPSKFAASLSFVAVLIVCVWWSAWIVDRISVVMMGGMAIAFVMAMSGLWSEIRVNVLLDAGGEGPYAVFVWVALSTYLTSFCFHGSVPSLVKYFGKRPKEINKCLIYGTFAALVCYLVWITACDGSISRAQFKDAAAAGGNVGDLVLAAGSNVDSGFILRMLEAFSFLAVATSFLGAGLGLFDYIADLFGFDDSRMGRSKTTLVTFLPPTLGGLLQPDGFLYAIGWAGLVAAVWSVVIPALMLRAGRKTLAAGTFRAPGGDFAVPVLLIFGSGTVVCHVLAAFGILPMYK